MQAHHGLPYVMLALIILLAACGSAYSPRIEAEARPESEFSHIEKLAFQSCMCKLAGRDSSGADRAFKAATTALETVDGIETPALPVHISRTCYPKFGPDACLADFWVHEPFGDGAVCSYEQTEALFATGKAAYRAHPDNHKLVRDAIRTSFDTMRAEAAAKIPQSACN